MQPKTKFIDQLQTKFKEIYPLKNDKLFALALEQFFNSGNIEIPNLKKEVAGLTADIYRNKISKQILDSGGITLKDLNEVINHCFISSKNQSGGLTPSPNIIESQYYTQVKNATSALFYSNDGEKIHIAIKVPNRSRADLTAIAIWSIADDETIANEKVGNYKGIIRAEMAVNKTPLGVNQNISLTFCDGNPIKDNQRIAEFREKLQEFGFELRILEDDKNKENPNNVAIINVCHGKSSKGKNMVEEVTNLISAMSAEAKENFKLAVLKIEKLINQKNNDMGR